MTKPKLLSDDQIRGFIVDGFISLKVDVEPEVNEDIHRLLKISSENESPHGNNVLSRVPKMHEVLRCSSVEGALLSLLGPDYLLHPHRALHKSTPIGEKLENYTLSTDGHQMGKGSTATSIWHQDAQSPLARARHHLPRYLIGFYYPHAVTKEMGPTRIQLGSYMHTKPSELSNLYQPDYVEAGTFLLLHFDTVHAGFPNQADTDRYMMKFVFARTSSPDGPSWDHRDTAWHVPPSVLNTEDLAPAWIYIWDWLRGEHNGERSTKQPNSVNASVQGTAEAVRIKNIYALSPNNEVSGLIGDLLNKKGLDKHERLLLKDLDGNAIPKDDISGREVRWNERAVVMEDSAYRLATMGDAAIEPLIEVIETDDPWLQINASFALGEIGVLNDRVQFHLLKLLRSKHHEVVRQALDTLAIFAIHLNEKCLSEITKLVCESNRDWCEPIVFRGWTGQDQVRMNISLILLSAAKVPSLALEVEKIGALLLSDSNGYASAISAEAMIRANTRSSLSTAVQFLSDRRWDDTLIGQTKGY